MLHSEPGVDVKGLRAEDDAHKSVTSSEAATSESQCEGFLLYILYHNVRCVFIYNINKLCVLLAVVSLNDTEELSSTEEEEEEDSGSEVEIIEEVKGNGMQQHLFLQDLQPEDEFLQEQTAAVLSLVTDPQLKVRRSSRRCHMTIHVITPSFFSSQVLCLLVFVTY